jgi:DDE superfamily endonuclease
MNQHRYHKEILAEHGLVFYETIKEMRQGQEKVLWIEDGARYHGTKANKKWKAARSFDAMPWLAQSLDLNPIENLWSIIKRRISKKWHIIKTAEEMAAAVQKEWNSLMEADYLNCVDSMQKRVKQCYKAKGGHIKY